MVRLLKECLTMDSTYGLPIYDKLVAACITTALTIALIYPNDSLIRQEMNVTYLCIFLLASLLAITGYSLFKAGATIKVNLIDTIFLLFAIYITLNTAYKNLAFPYSVRLQGWLASITVYMLIRSVKNTVTVLLYILQGYLLISTVLIVLGYLQLMGIAASNSPFFTLTGPFHNPAPFSCHLMLASIISYSLYSKKKLKGNSIILGERFLVVYLALNIVLLIFTQSRSAWLAALVGFTIIALTTSSPTSFIQRMYHKRQTLYLAIPVLMIILTLLYQLRPLSADGRLLIWKISTFVFLDAPLTGVGSGNYSVAYNNKQIEYFSLQDRPVEEISLADFVTHPFNEPILLITEHGIIGLGFLIAIAYLLIRGIKSLDADRSMIHLSVTILVALIVFGFTSYPSDYTCFTLIFFINLPLLSYGPSRRLISLSHSVVIIKSLQVVILCYAILSLKELFHYGKNLAKWNVAYREYELSIDKSTMLKYESLHNMFNKNGIFLLNYGILLSEIGENAKAVTILHAASKAFVKPELYMALGDSYRALNQVMESETAYLKAAYLVPGRRLPRLRLAELYLQQGDTLKSRTMAQSILHMPIKIDDAHNQKVSNDVELLLYRLNK